MKVLKFSEFKFRKDSISKGWGIAGRFQTFRRLHEFLVEFFCLTTLLVPSVDIQREQTNFTIFRKNGFTIYIQKSFNAYDQGVHSLTR